MDTLQEKDVLLLRNLKDAGCDTQTVEQFFQLQNECKIQQQLRLLSRQKNLLLRKVHENQAKVDCLDYLIYSIKSNAEAMENRRRKTEGRVTGKK